jgi:hypothetical protein
MGKSVESRRIAALTGCNPSAESGYIEEFFSFIVRGLLWHHWKTLLTPHDSVDVTVLTKAV